MTWRTINSPLILEQLVKLPVIGSRFVCLSELVSSAKSMSPGRVEVQAVDTDPAAVVVFDMRGQRPVAAYAWCGQGGKVTGARDVRLVQLVDALEAEFRDAPPPAEWLAPGPASSDPPGGSTGVEFYLGDGVRGAVDDLTPHELVQLIETCATCEQVRTLGRLFRKPKGYGLVSVLNVRTRGGPATGEVMPVVSDRFGQLWVVKPAGTLDRMEDDD
jgi:hypothetical protein